MPPCKSCSERYDINQRLKYIKDILYPQHRINVRHAFTAKSQVSSGDVQKRRDWLKWLAEMVEVLNHWRKTPLHKQHDFSSLYIYICIYIYKYWVGVRAWCDHVTANIDYVICKTSTTITLSYKDTTMKSLRDLRHCDIALEWLNGFPVVPATG